MRYVSLLVCVLAGFLYVLTPPAHSADLQQYLTVRLEPPEPGSTSNNLELVLENRSSKDIVAYGVEITTTAIDAPPRTTGWIEDYVPGLASVGKTAPTTDKHAHDGPIRPGDIVYRTAGGATTNALTSIKVTMVVFGDNTALGDASKIDAIFREHKAAADELDRWRPRFDSPRPYLQLYFQTLKDELTSSLSQQPASPEEAAQRRVRLLLATDITSSLKSKDLAGLEQWREYYKNSLAAQAKAYREHSELRKEGE